MKTIEFFFDFTSPYAYLANCPLPALADKFGYELVYRPIDLFAAKQAAGNNGPPSPQIPNKFRYIQKDLLRWAEKYGVPFKLPKPAPGQDAIRKGQIDSSRANKGMFFAMEQGRGREYASRVWSKTFGSGGLIGDDENLRSVAQEMGWSPEALFDFIHSDKAEKLYEDGNEVAHGRGVFGVPIMMVGDEMWWGNDRLSLLEEYLAVQSAS